MLVVARFRTPSDLDGFLEQLTAALDAFAACPGYVRGRVGRSVDEPSLWLLSTEWDGVGAYRRALSSYDVKVRATGLLGQALPEPGAFEVLVRSDQPGPTAATRSGRDVGSR